MTLTLTAEALVERFGGRTVGKALARFVAGRDFRFETVGSEATAILLRDIDQKIDGGTFQKVGAHREEIWQDAWSEQYSRFRQADFALDALEPQFMGANPISRLDQAFIRPYSKRFEVDFFLAFRSWLFETWVPETKTLIEFGSGSGFNLAAMASHFPDRHVTGLDWSQAACSIADAIGSQCGLSVRGRQFDFFDPDYSFEEVKGATVFTFCALEQTGDRFTQFLEYLRMSGPARVIHMEPIIEFYNPASPVDAAALRYHRDRRYLNGLATWLRNQAAEGTISLLAERRLFFGSLYHEGYSYLIWEPA